MGVDFVEYYCLPKEDKILPMYLHFQRKFTGDQIVVVNTQEMHNI